ncbi:J domain-containing protein [Ramlibacter sp. AN1133]|uniref:J domain-containing protein n=1 Tax=Ramlibacter sp. AN1133 TaxID=3133429 RepID=UPI0030C657BB
MSRLPTLQIPAAKAGPLGPQQKRFNTLIRQIEQARGTLAAWKENVPLYRQAHQHVLVPLQQELQAAFRQWLSALDILVDQKGWSKAERSTLRELICDSAQNMLLARGEDAGIKALYDKHADVDFDTEQREMTLVMKALAEEVTGLDLGDDEIHSDDVLFERMREGFTKQSAAQEARRQARAARKTKTAAQQRREAEAQQATQSVREIYRKLASSLHPDRETDERERAAKTQLMQQVNQAYAAGDLLALLELQLRIEQIDASHVATASESRLKHYNKVLAEQLEELKTEIQDAGIGWSVEFNLPPFTQADPRRLGEVIEQMKRAWRAELAQLQKDLRMFADAAATKRWLKQQRQRLARNGYDLPF